MQIKVDASPYRHRAVIKNNPKARKELATLERRLTQRIMRVNNRIADQFGSRLRKFAEGDEEDEGTRLEEEAIEAIVQKQRQEEEEVPIEDLIEIVQWVLDQWDENGALIQQVDTPVEDIEKFLEYYEAELNAYTKPRTPDFLSTQWAKDYGSNLITGILHREYQNIASLVGNSIAIGDSRENLKRTIQKAYPNWEILPEWRARLIAQTELTRAYNATALQRAKDSGFSAKIWYDGQPAACESCKSLHEMSVLVDDEFTDEVRGMVASYPPLHPACRCTHFAVNDDEYAGMLARASVERAA